MRLGLLFTILFLPVVALAQDFSGIAQQNHLVVDPPFPEPGQTVSISVNDYSGGLFGAQISWQRDGEVIPDSINQRSVEIEAGELGVTERIAAVFTAPNGSTETLSTTLRPVYLDIIIEPQTRVPDWYLGRGMPTLGSQINATALVNDGTMLDPAGLVYTWQVNQTVLDSGPVRGRNRMSFETPRGNNFLLNLTVTRATGETVASQLKSVEVGQPTLRFYEQHALYGSQQFPITQSTALIGNSIKLQAEPFNLDTRVYNDPDVAVWEINRYETDNGSRNPYEITLQRTSASGATDIKFHVRSLQEVLQGAEDNIVINF